MSEDLVSRALERLRRATALDGAGEGAAAADEYDAGVVLLARAMAVERDPAMRDTLAAKCGEYADRADALRAAHTEPPRTRAEQEQADLEARLAALRGAPPRACAPADASARVRDLLEGRGSEIDDVPRSADEEADEIVRRALAEVRAEEKEEKGGRRGSDNGAEGEGTEGEEDEEWAALEAQAARECEGGDDDEAVRAMIAASRAELERAMRAEDPAFCWDDYDLPSGTGGTAPPSASTTEHSEHVLGSAQRRLDALKRYIARHQSGRKP